MRWLFLPSSFAYIIARTFLPRYARDGYFHFIAPARYSAAERIRRHMNYGADAL